VIIPQIRTLPVFDANMLTAGEGAKIRDLEAMRNVAVNTKTPDIKRAMTTSGQISLQEAAIRLHEAEESAGVQETRPLSSLSPEDAILAQCKYILLTEAHEKRVALWGTRPPSRNPTQIQVEEIPQYSPAPGSSDLNPLSSSVMKITDVWISDADLQAAIKCRIDLLKSLGAPPK
jgi:hypothetical protein